MEMFAVTASLCATVSNSGKYSKHSLALLKERSPGTVTIATE